MACAAGPDVSESGLVLSLDAANLKSYPDSTNYYSTSETLTDGRVGSTSGGNYTDFTSGGPDGGRFTRWTNDTGTSGSTAWHWGIGYTNTGLSTGEPVIVSFYARCPNATVSNITLNSPDSVAINAILDSTWRKFVGTALYGGDYVSTPFVRINRGNTSTIANGATYDIALLKIQKGNIWTDLSGRGNNGTLVNGIKYNSGNLGSLVFDGSNDYITFSSTSLNLYPITLSFWATPTGDVINKYVASSVNGYRVSFGTGGISGYYFKSGSDYTLNYDNSYGSGSSSVFSNGVMTVDGTGVKFYINGQLVGSNSWTGTAGPPTTAEQLKLGLYSSSYRNGNIAQTTIYNRALTASEIQQNYNATRGRYGI